MQKIKVFLVCSGLGHINRGYESFTQECFDALSDKPELDLILFKGGGQSKSKQIKLWNLPRRSNFADWLGKKIGKSGYWVEQVTFALSLMPHILRGKPDVIYFSDTNVGNLLWHWRRFTKQSFKLLFSNGGPMKPPFSRWDYVQQLAPSHLEVALKSGYALEKQHLIPYGIHMELNTNFPSPEKRNALRQHLKLPMDRSVVLSVGIVNKIHKRMDYIVREVASLPEPRPFLMMLGQQDEETPEVRVLAEHLLGSEGFLIRTVSYQDVSAYYQAADLFVLASLAEGFGRVFLESMSWGLPCLAHDYALSRYVLGAAGSFADFEQTGNLTRLIRQALEPDNELPSAEQRYEMAFDRFSWHCLDVQYVAMLKNCVSR